MAILDFNENTNRPIRPNMYYLRTERYKLLILENFAGKKVDFYEMKCVSKGGGLHCSY